LQILLMTLFDVEIVLGGYSFDSCDRETTAPDIQI